MADETPAPPPSDFDPADPLKGSLTPAPTGGATDPTKKPFTPIPLTSVKPVLAGVLKQGHNLAATISRIDSVRLTPEEEASGSEALSVIIAPYLSKIENLGVVLALVSLLLMEMGVMSRAFGEYKRLHPKGPPQEKAALPPSNPRALPLIPELVGGPVGPGGSDDGPGGR